MQRSTLNDNLLRLATAQALAGANSAVVYATGAVIGNSLAPSPVLATLPISVFVAGMAVSTLPSGMITRRYGRRSTFMLGNLCGVLTGLLAAAGIVNESFVLLCIAMAFGGAYAAVVLSFRFAAAEVVLPEHRARALSIVMAGGVAAGVLGPQLADKTMNLWPLHAFAATYLAAAAVSVLSALVLWGVTFPKNKEVPRGGRRSMREILRQPNLLVAMVCGVASYMLMNFIMTSAPLAMHLCGLPLQSSNLGIQWHIVSMYGPSFFTGGLIARFGAPKVVFTGLISIAAAALVGLNGTTVGHFWLLLILLGLGWNFGFLGASAMVLECHHPEEKAQVQALNDFVVFGAMVIGSFASGGLLTGFGWRAVCLSAIPPVVLAVCGLILLARLRQRAVPTYE